jgi:hypothetical protein
MKILAVTLIWLTAFSVSWSQQLRFLEEEPIELSKSNSSQPVMVTLVNESSSQVNVGFNVLDFEGTVTSTETDLSLSPNEVKSIGLTITPTSAKQSTKGLIIGEATNTSDVSPATRAIVYEPTNPLQLWDVWLFIPFVITAITLIRSATAINKPLNTKTNDLEYDAGESWVTNFSIGSTLATAFVALQLLGDEDASTVAIFIALFGLFALLAPVVYRLTVREEDSLDVSTVGGLLLASALTLLSSFGQLYVTFRFLLKIPGDGFPNGLGVILLIVVGLFAILIFFYTAKTLAETVRKFSPPKKPKESTTTTLNLQALGEAEQRNVNIILPTQRRGSLL